MTESSSAIEGLGGVFVFTEDVPRLADWYARAFGLVFQGDPASGVYLQFFARDDEYPERRVDTTFSILRAERPMPTVDREGWDPSSMYGDQPYMVNLRVRDLEELLAHLRAEGIEILGSQDEPYGRFAWVIDPDGHRIELYESRMADWRARQASGKD